MLASSGTVTLRSASREGAGQRGDVVLGTHNVLDDWRERERRALDGKGWDPPQPLAIGSAARELVRRAWVDAD